MIEIVWKDIPGFENYEASNSGLIRRKTFLLKNNPNSYGYIYASLSNDSGQTSLPVHRWVMKTFKGESKLIVNHIDGNKLNNSIDNLEYISQKENITHARNVLKKEFGFKTGQKFTLKFYKKRLAYILYINIIIILLFIIINLYYRY